MVDAVFFDLDGTLADTAPDLGKALNQLRSAHGKGPLPLAELRPYASSGVRGMLRAGFALTPQDADYETLRAHFLDLYEACLCERTVLFPGMAELLGEVEARGIAWGVVTNKSTRFAQPLLQRLGLLSRMVCLVCGDSCAAAKPSPLPLFKAAELAGVGTGQCLYVGDDKRDIVAGRAAGMPTVAVRYGYLGDDGPIESWGATHIIGAPGELIAQLPDRVRFGRPALSPGR